MRDVLSGHKQNVFIFFVVLSSAYSQNLIVDLLLLSFFFWRTRNQYGLFLGVLITTPTLDLEIGGFTYRAILIFSLVFIVFKPFGIKKPKSLKLFWSIFAFLPLYITSLLGSFTNSKLVAFQFLVLGFCSYLIVSTLATNENRYVFFRQFLVGVVYVGVINAFVVLLQILRVSNDAVLGHLYMDRPTGLYLEPDFLGYFALISLIALYYLKQDKFSLLAALPLGFSLVISLARASWISGCIFVLLYVLFKGGIPRSLLKILTLLYVSFIFFVLVVDLIPTSQLSVVQERFQSITVQQTSDTARLARIRQWDGLSRLAADSPWYGAGLTSSGRVLMQGSISNQKTTNNVGSNWILSLWAEAKFLAIPYFIYVSYSFLWTRRTFLQPMLLVTLINSLFTNMVWYTITPVLLALANHFFSELPKTEKNFTE
jgi:hypothetical protein